MKKYIKHSHTHIIQNITDPEMIFHYDDAESSALVIIQETMKIINPKSVVDVGCGDGTWLSVFQKMKVKDFIGIDAYYIQNKILKIPAKNFIIKDLRKPFRINRIFDLVVSLEVAEHLPEKSAEEFVKSLTKLGPVILFSAAIPFQGGYKHINEQWPDYWDKLFKKNGYISVDCLRAKIWNNRNVKAWYAQNIFLYIKKDFLKKYPSLTKSALNFGYPPLSLVHPYIYESHRTSLSDNLKFKIHSILKRT